MCQILTCPENIGRGLKLAIFSWTLAPSLYAQFEEFTKKTGFKTEAEKFGNAGVLLKNGTWELVDSADFRYPQGRSKPPAEANHPVTASFLERCRCLCHLGRKTPAHSRRMGIRRHECRPKF